MVDRAIARAIVLSVVILLVLIAACVIASSARSSARGSARVAGGLARVAGGSERVDWRAVVQPIVETEPTVRRVARPRPAPVAPRPAPVAPRPAPVAPIIREPRASVRRTRTVDNRQIAEARDRVAQAQARERAEAEAEAEARNIVAAVEAIDAVFNHLMFGGTIHRPLTFVIDGRLARPAHANERAAERATPRELRQREARAIGNDRGPGAVADAYYEIATEHTSDAQNTHDPLVLANLRGTIARLREDQAGAAVPTPAEIAESIQRDPGLDREKAGLAASAALRMSEPTLVVGIGATDAECLGRVWLRAEDPRNSRVRGDMRQAVIDALADCWENGSIVCSNGRADRMLAALVLVDHDKRNWEVNRLEQFRNDAFAAAGRAISEAAAAATADPDPAARQAGALYLARTAAELAAIGDPPAAAVEALAARMRSAASAAVAARAAACGVPDDLAEATIADALAAI